MVKTKNCLITAFYFAANQLIFNNSVPRFSLPMNNPG